MKSSAKKIELASVDDLFSTEESRQDEQLEKIQEIPLSELHPFKDHPFKVKDDDAMIETADSIKKYYRELILENIEYDCLKQRYPLYLDDLNEIVELLVETVCAKRKTTRISGADFPHEIVRSRFLKLDSSHIEFVMDCLQKNTTQVHNIKQYLLAVLFNAPTTMNNHYTSLVNHDMHAGGW